MLYREQVGPVLRCSLPSRCRLAGRHALMQSALLLGKKRWGKRFCSISCRDAQIRDPKGPLIGSLVFCGCLLWVPRGGAANRQLATASSPAEAIAGIDIAAPSRYVTLLPEIAGTRSPGTRIPTRFSGSAADSVIVPACGIELAHRSHRFHRDRQGKLLAQKSIDKTPAANFAAILQPAEARQQLAPRRQVRFPRQHIADHNSVTPQQHPAGRFDRARPLDHFVGMQQSPASRIVPRTRRRARCPAPPAAWDRSASADCRSRRQSPDLRPPTPKAQSRFPLSACPCRARCRQRTTRPAAAENPAPSARRGSARCLQPVPRRDAAASSSRHLPERKK